MTLVTLKRMAPCCCCSLLFLQRTPVFQLCRLKNSSRKISTMKAVRIHSFGGPSVLQVDSNVPIPTLNHKQVLVKVCAAGINPVDAQIREQMFSYKFKLPIVLGKEVAGDVVDTGAGLGDSKDQYKPGDRVVCCLPHDGGYAEYVACDVDNIIKLPSHISYAQGAGIYVAYFTAFRGLITKLKVQSGELVLIHGASGAVGTAAVQVAKSIGAVVVGTAGTKEGSQLVKDIGADYVVNHRNKGHLVEAVAMIPGCKGFNAILENQASTNLSLDLESLTYNGRIAVVGANEKIKIDPRFLISNESSITGVKMTGISREEWKAYESAITNGMRDGWLRPVVAREYNMDEVQLAHEHLMKRHGHLGKLVLKIS